MSDYKSVVLGLINTANDTTYTLADVSLSVPEAAAVEGIDRNSKVTVTGLPGSLKIGRVVLYYDRQDLAAFVALRSRRFVVESPTTSQDLLAAFNERFGTFLSSSDIVTEALPAANADGVITYELKVTSICYGFIGKVVVTIVQPPVEEPLT